MTKEKLKQSVSDNATTPSMEDILSSIRGIINDDISMTEETKKDNLKEEDILELTEIVEEQEEEIVAIDAEGDKKEEKNLEERAEEPADKELKKEAESLKEQIDPETTKQETESEVIVEAKPSEEANKELIKEEVVQAELAVAEKKSSLLSGGAASEAKDAMRDLLKKSLKPTSDGLSFRSGVSLEDIVVEAMTPYLTKWLDDNLPSIVKHLVSKEIQKLVPKEED